MDASLNVSDIHYWISPESVGKCLIVMSRPPKSINSSEHESSDLWKYVEQDTTYHRPPWNSDVFIQIIKELVATLCVSN